MTKWKRFSDEMPDQYRPVFVLWTSANTDEWAIHECQFVNYEYGKLFPDGFGDSFHEGRNAEKSSDYHHLELKDSGIWCYVSDLAIEAFAQGALHGADGVDAEEYQIEAGREGDDRINGVKVANAA